MPIHSQLLVHWTGRDLHDAGDCRSPIDDSIRKEYVARLRDTCQNGLFMNRAHESIHGRTYELSVSSLRVCFTEIRLSAAHDHASRYGFLGIGVHRTFALERGGNPVFYVQSGEKGTINHNLTVVGNSLKQDGNRWRAYELVFGHLKNMSEPNSAHLKYYDEMEWRIVAFQQGLGSLFVPDPIHKGASRLVLQPVDVRLLVLPDPETMKMALSDSMILEFIKAGAPSVTTVDASENF